jgi:glycosyl transferase family 25
LWTRLLDDDADQYIVLEDDVIADWAMMQTLARTDFRRAGISYLRLYYLSPSPFIVRDEAFLRRGTRLLELTAHAFGSQAYVITRAAARKLVEHCRTVRRPIDDELDRYWDHGIPNLAIFPFPVVEQAGASVIGAERFTEGHRSAQRMLFLVRDRMSRALAALRRRAFGRAPVRGRD